MREGRMESDVRYRGQGIIHGVIHLQFEDIDVVLGLYYHIGTTENALHLSVHHFTFRI